MDVSLKLMFSELSYEHSREIGGHFVVFSSQGHVN